MLPESVPAVLVVDDDEVSLAVICMMLDADGWRVIQASSGEEAVKKAAELPDGDEPAVVLADLQMPGLCGRELALALRTMLPRAMLVAMSASPGATGDYDAFVSKPLDVAAFRALIERAPQEQAARSDTGSSAVLNEEVYLKLQRMMPAGALAEVYDVCLNDARTKAQQMKLLASGEGADLAALRRTAHAIKGGAGMVGASRLAHAASELESGGYGRDDVAELINKLLDCCDELQRILVTKVPPP
jgi:CheY-like chemotaxis protein